jgi:hypothetical protein
MYGTVYKGAAQSMRSSCLLLLSGLDCTDVVLGIHASLHVIIRNILLS